MLKVHGAEMIAVRALVFFFFLKSISPLFFPAPGGYKLPSPSIKHPSSCSNRDPGPPVTVSHLLSCWYHSNDSLAKINQIFWKALYPLPRCVTDVRQTWLHLSPWQIVGCWTRMDAWAPAETAGIDKHGPPMYVQQWRDRIKYIFHSTYTSLRFLDLRVFHFMLLFNFYSATFQRKILFV